MSYMENNYHKNDGDELKQQKKSNVMQWILCGLFIVLFVCNLSIPFGWFCLLAAAIINPWLIEKFISRGVEIPIVARIVVVMIVLMMGVLFSPSMLDLSYYYSEEDYQKMLESPTYSEEFAGEIVDEEGIEAIAENQGGQ